MNIVNKNIIANYVGKLWGFISIFIFIRFYIEILGIQSYAIINFYSVILGLIAFADAGLTATLNRELAKDISVQDKSNLVYTAEKIYLGICVFVIVLIYVLSDYIAQNFLKTDSFTRAQISYFIKLIGVGIGLQLFSTLYEGGLMGLQKQVLTNKIKIVWSLCRSGIVILPLLYVPSLEVYFIWQIFCNTILLLTFKRYISKELNTLEKPIFSKELLQNIWKYALGMMGIAFISAINIQIDKLVTSKYLDLKSFGYYSLATTIAQIPLLVSTPIIVAVFPMLSMLVSTNEYDKKKEHFHRFSFIITVITAPIAACIFLYTTPLIVLWTGNIEIANQINLTVKILIIGGFFLCLQLMPYYVGLANGHTRTNIVLGIVGLFVIIPLIIYSVKKFGMIGATFPWLLINVISFLIISIIILKKFLPNEFLKWILQDVLLPVMVTVGVAIPLYFATPYLKGKYWFIFDMGLIFIVSLYINILIYNKKNPVNKLIDFNVLKIQTLK
jgi:O-antigen/teichoic acid export membrane protein